MTKAKRIISGLLYDIAGSVFYAVGVYTFAKAGDFAPGGITGLALIINYIYKLPVGITTFLLNIPLIFISLKYTGKNFVLKSLKSMIMSTVFLDVIFPRFPLYSGNRFVTAFFSGIFIGIGMALFYMHGSSSGGTDFITMSVKAVKPHLSIGTLTMGIDVVIILMGFPVFGSVDSVLYGMVSTIIFSVTIDRIMYGFGGESLVIIVTDKGKEIATEVSQRTGRGSTELSAIGSYSHTQRQIILCACSKTQAYTVKSISKDIDGNAFIMISKTSEVYGEGF